MRRSLRVHAIVPVLALVASCVLASSARAERRVYYCVLSPHQIPIPPLALHSVGAGRFVIDTDANTVTYWISDSKLSSAETSAHIHGDFSSPPGGNGALRVTLPAGNPKVGVWSYTEDLESIILNGLAYVDIHTSTAPSGELRGQIVPLNAVLDGVQVSPPVATVGNGWATFTLNTATHQLSYFIWYNSLTGAVTTADFHGPALHLSPAAQVLPLAVTISPLHGTVSYAPADEPAIRAGRWYVDLHTTAHPGGEIRGQVAPIVVPMDHLQVSPPSPAVGSSGYALFAIDTLANVLSYDVHVDSVSTVHVGDQLHGFAPLGANGVNTQVTWSPAARHLGTFTYAAANESEYLLGHAYVDAHTTANPNGEIRGQVMFLPGSDPLLGVDGSGPALMGVSAAPNPFGRGTSLSFQLARTGTVSLAIMSVDGRLVRRVPPATFAPGPHSFQWDGLDDAGQAVAPGVYFAVVHTPDGDKTTRLARLK